MQLFCCYPYGGLFGTNGTECLAEEGSAVCSRLGGTSFGNGLFCTIPGNDYLVFGDDVVCECVLRLEMATGIALVFSMENGDYTVGAPMKWVVTTFNMDHEFKRV